MPPFLRGSNDFSGSFLLTYNELFAVIFMGHLKRDNCIIKRRHKNTHPKRRENSCMGRAFGFVTIGIPAAILMTMLLMMPLVVR